MTNAPPAGAPTGPAGDMRVLLAEAERPERTDLAAALAAAGYEVCEAGTAETALAEYAREPAPLVLVDTDLGGLGGIEVCRRIRALDPAGATFILVFSRSERLEPMLAALAAGADDYMLQAGSVAHLRARLALAERRLEQEAARRAAEAEAARARYLAGVGEMAIALQHEINNPLAAILAHAELMAMDAADDGQPDDSLRTILEQARRIADVVRRLSSLRNPTSVEYVPGRRMVHLHEEGGGE